MALDIDKTFRFVQFVSNKESRGWIAPEEFNIVAELAQISVYSRLESMFLSNKKVHNDMRPFIDTSAGAIASGQVTLPAKFRQFIGARLLSSGVEVVELTQAELTPMLNSTVTPPTVDYPNCVVRSTLIDMYPDSLTGSVILEYMRNIATTPTWGYTVPSVRPVYDPVSSVDFEFDDNLFMEIATNILMNVGMNLDKEAVTQYGMAFNK